MSDLGEMLRNARRQKNLSLEDVAAATRIKEPFLGALEDGDYGLLPGPAYITGFLRNYASYLGLHPDDVVQEYYATRPLPQPTVRAATRVLASGYHRETRARLVWILGVVVLFLAAGYAIKQYNDSTAHAYSPPVYTTSIAGTISPTPATKHAVKTFTVRLRAIAPAWVRVSVDGHQAFQGILRAGHKTGTWTGHRSIYVATLDGAHVRVTYNSRHLGLLAAKPGLIVNMASPSGWHRVT